MSALGDFSVLPLEIRSEIWQSLEHTHLGPILRSSRKLYDEVLSEYFARELVVEVKGTTQPALQPPGRCSQCHSRETIEWTSFGAPKRCVRCLTPWVNISRLNMIQCTMPLARFRRTVIEVHPPDPKDPGQLVRVWSGLGQVLKVICQIPRQSIKIHFRIDQQRSWFEEHFDGGSKLKRVQRSVPAAHKSDLDFLVPLCLFIRCTKACEIIMPSHAPEETALSLNEIAQSARDSALSTLEFTNITSFNPHSSVHLGQEYDKARRYHNHHFFKLNHLLNDLLGDTAALIRRDRSAHWLHYRSFTFELYFWNMDRLVRERPGYSQYFSSN